MTKETVALYLENGFKGRRNVISSRELERVLGISGNELRRRVNRLRQDTVPIAADQRGYYFAETAAEVYHASTQLDVLRQDAGHRPSYREAHCIGQRYHT